MNRWQRILVRVLVVAQLLAAAPFASASPVTDQGMGGMATHDECPCCPDGADSLRDCLAACTLAALALPCTEVFARTLMTSLRVDSTIVAPLVSLADPPLKPPPIR